MPINSKYIIGEPRTYTPLNNATFSDQTDSSSSNSEVNGTQFYNYLSWNGIYMQNIEENSSPLLVITEQPSNVFRYRYKSEKGSHGGIKGQSNSPKKKSFPTVMLKNCPPSLREKITIRVSLYRNESEPKLHAYELLELNKKKRDAANGKCEAKLDENFEAVFPTIAIETRKKEEVFDILKQRKLSYYDSAEISYEASSLDKEVQDEISSINLDSAKLYFEAFSDDNKDTPLCEGVFSTPVNNQKSAASGDLRIVRLSQRAGKCSGEEEIYLLCEKIKKEDIKVRFFEKSGEDVVWEGYGDFTVADVHKQFAIVFKTPKYHKKCGKVFIELLRPSDSKTSEPREFEYLSDDEGILKRENQYTSVISLDDKKDFSPNSKKRKRNSQEEICQDLKNDNSFQRFNDESSWNIDDKLNVSFLDNDNKLTESLMDILEGDWELSLFPELSSTESDAFELENINKGYTCEQKDNYVRPDGISTSMGLLSLADKGKQEPGNSETLKASEDFDQGMQTLLQNRLLHYAPHLIAVQDQNGNSMLHLAIIEQCKNLSLIKKMLEMAPEDLVNHPNNFQETPLHLAVKGNHIKIFLLLLLKGGNPNIQDKNGNSCLHLAAKYGHAKLLTLMLPAKRPWKYKISDINVVNFDGLSALHISVMKHFEDCVVALLKCKADVNLPEKKSGRTSLHLALEQPSVLRIILMQPETDVHVKDFGGFTPVHLACRNMGKSFEAISSQLKDDKEKIKEFLGNLNQSSETESDGGSTDPNSESESDDDSTNENVETECVDLTVHNREKSDMDAADCTDAVKEEASCNEVDSKTESIAELMCRNGTKSSLMKTEEELCKFLDANENWKQLALLMGLPVEYVETFDKNLSPGRTVLKDFKESYPSDYLTALIGLLELAALEEGVQIVQKNS